MQRIKSKGMKPELLVRRLVHRLGYRYRLHRADLPGKPDLVFVGRRKVIFVHGCFWHQHPDPSCRIAHRPRSNLGYWEPKLNRNIERDERTRGALLTEGWDVLTLWECELKCEAWLEARLREFLGPGKLEGRSHEDHTR
jgi:DNA mismatch endonuclease (patch repair protein)